MTITILTSPHSANPGRRTYEIALRDIAAARECRAGEIRGFDAAIEITILPHGFTHYVVDPPQMMQALRLVARGARFSRHHSDGSIRVVMAARLSPEADKLPVNGKH